MSNNSLAVKDCFDNMFRQNQNITKTETMQKNGLSEFSVILAVARHQGFRRAAAELDMSVTAVSNAVAGLESRLGVRLFHRTTRSVSLTEAGQRFVSRAEPAVRQLLEAMDAASSGDTLLSGTLRINSSLGAALMVFAPVFRRFTERYPAISLDIVTEGRRVDIISEGFDAGIRPDSRLPQDMIAVPLIREIPLVVVASAGYFDQSTPPQSPTELLNFPCIRSRLPGGLPSGWHFWQNGQPLTLDVSGPLVLDSPQLMLEAVKQGCGIAQVPQWYVAEELLAGRLVTVLDNYAATLPGVSLYYAGRRHIPAALKALITIIHEVNDEQNRQPRQR